MEHLYKAYGTTVAVDDVSFSVRRGEIFGSSGAMALARRQPWSASRACGPNGGQAQVLGLDPRQDREELHERLGVQLQQGALPPKLKVARPSSCTRRSTNGRSTPPCSCKG
jgi:ABC-2 type transport system ATP-binding protein